MSVEPRGTSREDLGSLQNCLVGGDPEQTARERRVRRRALAVSATLEGVVVAAVVLIPLFGRPAGIALTSMPLPPYYQRSSPHAASTQSIPQEPRHAAVCVTCTSRPFTPFRDEPLRSDVIGPLEPPGPAGPGIGLPCPGCIEIPGAQDSRPAPPPEETHPNKTRIHTQLDPAMLIRRVEPVYPVLPRQLGRSGRVELRAIIATDGTIQSLQVVGGDPMFYESALEAVRQWRYRPTVLNGQPVEVDTYITVIYHLER